jgi:hypothetical protein
MVKAKPFVSGIEPGPKIDGAKIDQSRSRTQDHCGKIWTLSAGRAPLSMRRKQNPERAMIIPPTWNLPEAIRTRLGQSTVGRQRAIVEDGHLLLVLHKPPGPDDRNREGALFWRNPAGEWQANRGGSGPGALKRHVQSYAELEGNLAHDYEAASDTAALFELLESLTPLDRAARNMHQTLQVAREAMKADPFMIEMRDLASDVERNFDLLVEDVRNAVQYRMAREGEEQARLSKEAVKASHRLNILAAWFFPLTAISSVFGMNFSHGLDEHRPVFFWVVFALGVGLGFAMKSWVLGRSASKNAPQK